MVGKHTATATLHLLAAALMWSNAGLADGPSGTVYLGGSTCPPNSFATMPPGMSGEFPVRSGYPPSWSPPFIPNQPFAGPQSGPGMSGFTPPSSGGMAPSGAQPPGAPAQATPTFTPSQASTAATSPQSTAPNLIGDFFGAVTTEPIILPGAQVDQAILFTPGSANPNSGLIDYYRSIVPEGTPGLFITDDVVYVGPNYRGVPTSVDPSQEPPQLLGQYDGSLFTGDPADLLGLLNGGPFMALDSGTQGDVELVAPEQAGTTLLNQTIYNIHDALLIFLPSPGSGGGVGRQKIVENNSVFPRDRVFLNYSAFSNVPLSDTGENVHRYVPGFEMAFLEEQMSVEVRLPFAATLSNDIRAGGFTNRNEVEFGNVITTLKALIYNNNQRAVSVGVSGTFPTAADLNVRGFDGSPVLSLENTSVHVLPFLGVAQSKGRWYVQGFVQGDIDTSGNRVEVYNESTDKMQEVGELHDAAFLYASASVLYWVYQNGSRETQFMSAPGQQLKRTVVTSDRWITGFAPIAELHFNRSLEKSETVEAGAIQIRSFDQFSLTNLVLGGLLTVGNGGSINVAWATPIIGQDDKQFDNEIRVFLDWAL